MTASRRLDSVRAVRAGLLGGMAMEAWGFLTHQMGLSPLSMSAYEGGMVTGRTSGLASRAAGVGAHLVLSAAIAVPYALVLQRTGHAGPAAGTQLGVLHWLIAGLVLPGFDALSPPVRDGRIRALGRFATGYGSGPVAAFLIGHLLYGAVVGHTYAPDRER